MREKILFLPSWYPSRIHSISGIFIRNHAQAVSLYCDVAVLFVTADRGLKKNKYEIEFIEDNNVKTTIVYYKKFFLPIPLIKKLINTYRYLKANYKGLKVIKKKFGNPDLTHVNIILPAGIMGLLLKLLKGIPFVLTEQWTGYLPQNFSDNKIGGLYKILIKVVVKFSASVMVVSNCLKKAMLEQKLYNENYKVIPNVVTVPNNFSYQYDNNKKHTKKIVHISLLKDRQKNVIMILRVLYKILNEKKHQHWEFHILGDGIDRQRLENISKELGLFNNYVYFHGIMPPNEVINFLYGCDFLITNSNYETFSVATAEAIACGVPVIATRCGGPEDFVTEEVGILIEPGNEKQLEEAILYMLDNCDKYDKEKLKEYAKSKFSYEVVGKQFYDVYKSVLLDSKRIK